MIISLLISGLRGGGAERVCVTVANGLVARGHSVSLTVLSTEEQAYAEQLSPQVRFINLSVGHARTSFIALSRWLLEEQPTQVLVFNHQLTIVLACLRALMRGKFKIVARNINTLSVRAKHQNWWHGTVTNALTRLLYSQVDHVIAQSTGMNADLVENYRISQSQITTICNPASVEPLSCDQDTAKRNASEKAVLYVGRLGKQKGLEDLLSAFSDVVKNEPDATLYLVGTGPEEKNLRNLATKLGITESIHFGGFQSDVLSWYQRASVVVLTSHYEGFPNVLVEAIICGTPVVAFDCPSGPSEIIREGVNGYLILGRNKALFAQRVTDILGERVVFRPENVARTAERFRADVVLDQYEAVLKRFNS